MLLLELYESAKSFTLTAERFSPLLIVLCALKHVAVCLGSGRKENLVAQ